MGKYFGKQPRYSREEAEAQAKQAIDALVSRGRPPAEEWKGLDSRMGEINRELATRPPVDLPPPPPRPAGATGAAGAASGRRREIGEILRPRPPAAPEPELETIPLEPPAAATAPPAPTKRAAPARRAATAKRAAAPAAAAKKVAKRTTAPAAAAKPAAKRAAAKKRSG